MSKDEPQARGGFAPLGDVALRPAWRPGTGPPRGHAKKRESDAAAAGLNVGLFICG